MEYCATRLDKAEILAEGKYKGYNYYILSLGTHPTAYVEIMDQDDKFYKMHYNDANEEINVHGGLTFSDHFLKGIVYNTWILGWDYAHAGDMFGAPGLTGVAGDKEWTTQEILTDVKDVIDQIILVNIG